MTPNCFVRIDILKGAREHIITWFRHFIDFIIFIIRRAEISERPKHIPAEITAVKRLGRLHGHEHRDFQIAIFTGSGVFLWLAKSPKIIDRIGVLHLSQKIIVGEIIYIPGLNRHLNHEIA